MTKAVKVSERERLFFFFYLLVSLLRAYIAYNEAQKLQYTVSTMAVKQQKFYLPVVNDF